MEVPTLSHSKDPDAPDATSRAGFACPDLTTLCQLDELGALTAGLATYCAGSDRAPLPVRRRVRVVCGVKTPL